MAKFPTFPTLYNNVLQINISKLKSWGYLNPQQIKSGTINWSRNGNPTGSISIQGNTHSEQPYIELDYKYRGKPRNYKIRLVSVPSNLGVGKIWYFLCPYTKKRCRKLYSIGGYFLHREAFNGCMYEIQTHSKKKRQFDKMFNFVFLSDELYSELEKKNFKKTYAGKPTKRYLRIMAEIRKAESVSPYEINKLLLR